VLVIPPVRLRGVCTGNESRSRTTSLVHLCALLLQNRYRRGRDCGRAGPFSLHGPWRYRYKTRWPNRVIL
jgi:hypothetical protein